MPTWPISSMPCSAAVRRPCCGPCRSTLTSSPTSSKATLSTGAAELPEAAATARVSATQAFQHCAKNNIQVHGGMGFTWAFDCHLYYRRSNLLALNLGGLSTWEDALIARMRSRNTAA